MIHSEDKFVFFFFVCFMKPTESYWRWVKELHGVQEPQDNPDLVLILSMSFSYYFGKL